MLREAETARMFVQIEHRNADTIQVFVYDRMPNVPQWIQISLKPTARPFWTIPGDHYFEISEGQFGLPKELLAAAKRLDEGEIDQATAERKIAELLAIWSEATQGAVHSREQTQ
jgi:hypothetical protein